MAEDTRKQTLIAELAAARNRLEGYTRALHSDLNVGAHLKSGFARNPVTWVGGAALLGLLLSKIPPARRKVVVKGPTLRGNQAEKAGKAAMLVTLLKFGLDFAKPALLRWANQKLFSRSHPASSAR
jgi:hypothetical protein